MDTSDMPSAVLLSGACGSGKTTLLQLGYRTLSPLFGRVATLDTDWFLMLVDPRWELAHEERDGELMYRQCAAMTTSFFGAGFDTVLVGGNALHTRGGPFDEMIQAISSCADVHHITLDPSLEEIVRRVTRRGGDKTAEWLATHVDWMREKYEWWTSVIDNSAMTPLETAELIAQQVRDRQALLSPRR